jgi:hypothetical protein
MPTEFGIGVCGKVNPITSNFPLQLPVDNFDFKMFPSDQPHLQAGLEEGFQAPPALGGAIEWISALPELAAPSSTELFEFAGGLDANLTTPHQGLDGNYAFGAAEYDPGHEREVASCCE